MKLVGAFLIGALLGAGVVYLVPRWHPSPGVVALQDSATAARGVADDSAAIARAAIDSLNAWRPLVEEALRRPRRARPGPTPGTVVIIAPTPADTDRTVAIPPGVVDQLAQDSVTIFRLTVERDKAAVAIARLEGAARADTVADRLAASAHLAALADLEGQLADARREARVWKWAGRAVLIVGGAVAVKKGVEALFP